MTGSAFIVGSALAAGAAVLGSTVNAISQSKTNSAQRDLMHEQMAYQTSEREKTQEYNNPVNQKNRFTAAGMNPYLSMQQIGAGNSTAMSAPGAPQLNPPQYGDILKALGDSSQNGIDTYQQFQQAEQLQLGIDQQRVDTRYKLTEKLLQLNEQRIRVEGMNIDNKSKQQQIGYITKQMERLQQDIDFTNQTWDENKKTVIAQRKIAELESDGRDLGNDYQRMVNEMFPKLSRAQLDSLNASVELSLSSAVAARASSRLSYAQAATEAVNKLNKELEGKGMKLDQSQKRGLYKFTTEALRLENKHKKLSNVNAELETRSLNIGPIKIRPSRGLAAYQDRVDKVRYSRKPDFNSPIRLNTHLKP